MKKRFCLPVFFVFLMAIPSLKAQRGLISLTFIGSNNTQHARIDSIRVTNITFGCDTLLLYPDTVLNIELPAGIGEHPDEADGFRMGLIKLEPGKSFAGLWLPEAGTVDLMASDISGRLLCQSSMHLEAGFHCLNVVSGLSGIIMFSASWKSHLVAVKLPSIATFNRQGCKIEYEGYERIYPAFKTKPLDIGFSYHPGDKLIFSANSGQPKSAVWDSPSASKTIIFQFASNIPCIEEPEITYDGQVYHAVQIGSQCWLKENLNVGIMIPASQQQSDNSIIEKYCYDDNPDNCTIYGGLYQWPEAMQYNDVEGGQCLCPPGWHLATDLDWMILEGIADSQYNPGDPVWQGEGARGTDAGNNLKSASTWDSPGGMDKFGFSALAAGYTYYGASYNKGAFAHFWTSSAYSAGYPWMHWLRHDYSNPGRTYFEWENGRSVRCVRNQ